MTEEMSRHRLLALESIKMLIDFYNLLCWSSKTFPKPKRHQDRAPRESVPEQAYVTDVLSRKKMAPLNPDEFVLSNTVRVYHSLHFTTVDFTSDFVRDALKASGRFC